MVTGDNGKVVEEIALMANGRTNANGVQKPPFFYSREEGTFLGRSPKAWVQLIVFYIIFYICLAAFWCACLAIFLQTIDPNMPKFYGKGTIIGANPGVGFQPLLKSDPESTLIRFNNLDKNSYDKYVKTLDSYLSKYANINNTRICKGLESNSDIVQNGRVSTADSEACRFLLEPFEEQGCSLSNKFGFSTGKPCIILSLNRLIGWKPVEYDNDQKPKEIASRYKRGFITFLCDGTDLNDKEILGKVEYLPESGIDGRFYPYAVMNNYHQPIAMVKFTNLPKNRVVMVQCRAFAKNIEQDSVTGLGMVSFELFRVGN